MFYTYLCAVKTGTGKLFIVPTPVGNRGDITLRAIEVLQVSDVVYAEDTRTTGNLFQLLSIQTPLRSFHMHNEHKKVQELTDRILGGEQVSLVSDAGTPGISDPGYLAVRSCLDLGIAVECLPGATAFIPALVESGFPCDRFVFEGFLPVKKGRKTRLEAFKSEQRTLVFYESPYRVIKTLTEFKEVFGPQRMASVSREISKLYHTTQRGTIEELIIFFENHPPKGEFVIVISSYDSRSIY